MLAVFGDGCNNDESGQKLAASHFFSHWSVLKDMCSFHFGIP
jgi:hypothetical protein